ncbi:small GTP-binding protein, putative [Trichomonas vaginalis G3]|uniref:Small GTP-binding protein, putative n=1 Tax=Trichomonas vaginalis (strain ATCC PRA-98 / G3) TaxID=412133 RepID=A2E4A1_TRIV3|nr:GTPase protein [Trichomonas vaginalis G3]EAY12547.1 small GTP-binding protein, putative [Trichomonas vaginalis G3]KAI5554089.1 GTPase protein [Trichomonas vaginalis G3]|eukprot:XP_001324770.1 small GTP-binding protein [Trichomonas vaginalis G3]
MKADDDVLHCRVVVIGDSAVGKTSILNHLIENKFNQYEQSTVGANYQLYCEEVNDQKIEMQIWDTAGQEKFRSLAPIYFRNSAAAVAVYDQTCRQSFEHLETWIRTFTEIAGTDTVITIAANKCDLIDSIDIPFDEASEWAKTRGFNITSTSACSGEGVKQLFSALAHKLTTLGTTNKRAKKRVVEKEETSKCSC